jgi:hypothetical protein
MFRRHDVPIYASSKLIMDVQNINREEVDQSEVLRRETMHKEMHGSFPQPNFLKRMFGLEAVPETKSSWFAPLTHNLTIDFDSKGKQFMETVETVNERLKSLEDVSKRMQETVNKAASTMSDASLNFGTTFVERLEMLQKKTSEDVKSATGAVERGIDSIEGIQHFIKGFVTNGTLGEDIADKVLLVIWTIINVYNVQTWKMRCSIIAQTLFAMKAFSVSQNVAKLSRFLATFVTMTSQQFKDDEKLVPMINLTKPKGGLYDTDLMSELEQGQMYAMAKEDPTTFISELLSMISELFCEYILGRKWVAQAGPPASVVKSLANEIGGVKTIVSSVEYLSKLSWHGVSWAYAQMTGHPLIFDKNRKIAEMAIKWIEVYREMLSMIEKEKLVDSSQLCQAVVTHEENGAKIVQELVKYGYGKHNFTGFFKAYEACQDLALTAKSFLLSEKPRIQPLWLELIGAPGVGKSVCAKVVGYDLHAYNAYRVGKKASQTANIFFERKIENDFYDSYFHQFCMIIDDYFQADDAKIRQKTAMELISAVNSAAYHLHMAKMENKVGVFFDSKLVITTSNEGGVPKNCNLQDPMALARRKTIVVTVYVKPEFAQANGMIDKSKIPEGGSRDIWLFQLTCGLTGHKISDEIFDYDEFLRRLCELYDGIYLSQTKLSTWLDEHPYDFAKLPTKKSGLFDVNGKRLVDQPMVAQMKPTKTPFVCDEDQVKFKGQHLNVFPKETDAKDKEILDQLGIEDPTVAIRERMLNSMIKDLDTCILRRDHTVILSDGREHMFPKGTEFVIVERGLPDWMVCPIVDGEKGDVYLIDRYLLRTGDKEEEERVLRDLHHERILREMRTKIASSHERLVALEATAHYDITVLQKRLETETAKNTYLRWIVMILGGLATVTAAWVAFSSISSMVEKKKEVQVWDAMHELEGQGKAAIEGVSKGTAVQEQKNTVIKSQYYKVAPARVIRAQATTNGTLQSINELMDGAVYKNTARVTFGETECDMVFFTETWAVLPKHLLIYCKGPDTPISFRCRRDGKTYNTTLKDLEIMLVPDDDLMFCNFKKAPLLQPFRNIVNHFP